MPDSNSLRDDPAIEALLQRATAPKQEMHSRDHVQSRDDEQIDGLLQHAAAVQNNVLPWDQIRNGASVDGAMWLGFEKPTPVQQAGLIIFGGAFIMMGVAEILVMHDQGMGFSLFDVIGLGSSAIGIKIASNAFRRRKKKNLE